MSDKNSKKLSLKEQLQKDVLGYNQRIVSLTAQLNQTIGAKMEATGILKKINDEEKERQ